MRAFLPTWRYDRIFSIPLSLLRENGIRFLLVDMDNTLAPWHSTEVDEQTLAWCREAVSAGFDVTLLTNSKKQHPFLTAEKCGIGCCNNAKKPFSGVTIRLMEEKGMQKENTLIIGDQLFTDVQLANAIGVRSVLVKPISDQEWWCTRLLNRSRERLVWRFLFPQDKK